MNLLMQKLLLTIALLVLVSMVGCGGDQITPPTAPSSLEASQAAPSVTAQNDTATPTSSATSTLATLTSTSTLPTASVDTATPEPTPTMLPRLEAGQVVHLSQIWMFDTQQGWGVDTGHQQRVEQVDGVFDWHILHTRDGGSTWQDVSPPWGTYDAAFSELVGGGNFIPVDAVTARAGLEWKTTDAGQTWQPIETVFKPPLDEWSGPFAKNQYRMDNANKSLDFLNPQTGWYLWDDTWGGGKHSVSSYLAHTTDGGLTWQVSTLCEACLNIYSGLVFLDNNNGYISPYYLQPEVLGEFDATLKDFIEGNQAPHLMKTSDSGRTWQDYTLPPIADLPQQYQSIGTDKIPMAACDVRHLERVSTQGINALVACRLQDPQTYQFDMFTLDYLSLDGGQTWSILQGSGSVFFLNSQTGWRLIPGQLEETLDGGQTWQRIKQVNWEKADLRFVDPLIGWALVTSRDTLFSTGNKSALVKSEDGGKTWVEIKPVIGK